MGADLKCVMFATFGLDVRAFAKDYRFLLEKNVPVMVTHGDQNIRFGHKKRSQKDNADVNNFDDYDDVIAHNPGDCMSPELGERPTTVSRKFPEFVPQTFAAARLRSITSTEQDVGVDAAESDCENDDSTASANASQDSNIMSKTATSPALRRQRRVWK